MRVDEWVDQENNSIKIGIIYNAGKKISKKEEILAKNEDIINKKNNDP